MLIDDIQFSNALSRALAEANSHCLRHLKSVQLPIRTRSTPQFTLVLDLDETLVHSEKSPVDQADCVVRLRDNSLVYVKYRPGLLEFLEKSSLLFELVVFTASEQHYADSILDAIDPHRKFIKHRLYRDSCIMVSGGAIKDIRVLGRDLTKVVIVDNCFLAFAFNVDNGIPIASWFNDDKDVELAGLLNLLMLIKDLKDVRPCLNSLFNMGKLLSFN